MKRMSHVNHVNHVNHADHGFSLIEVLIAILVLALGLIGLAAVFPAVIVEQRRSFDTISGETVAEIAQDVLSGSSVVDVNPLRVPYLGIVGESIPPLGPDEFPSGLTGAEIEYSHLWIMDDFLILNGDKPGLPFASVVPGPQAGSKSSPDLESGNWRADSRENEVSQFLPVTARLHPTPESGLDPKYVWDIVARRNASGAAQIGVFVRRIDDRIRVPEGSTLSDVLTGDAPGLSRPTLPLALNIGSGRLTTDPGVGTGFAYPTPQSMLAYVDPRQPTWLIIPQGGSPGEIDTSMTFIRRVGQQLLDNTGTVRTVVAVPQPRDGDDLADEADNAVIVSPPFSSANMRQPGDPENDDVSPDRVRQFVFTPQTPVAVRVFTLEKE